MKKIKQKIFIFICICAVVVSSFFGIMPKTKASGYYPDTEYSFDTYLISKNDYGVISVNHAYNYIMGLGVSEQDQFELASIYQTNDDDNDYIKVIGYNALDNNNMAQVYIKVLCYNSSESANVQTLFTSQITTTSQWFLVYYRVDNEQLHTHNTHVFFTFGIDNVKNYNFYRYLPGGANGRDNVFILNNCSVLKDNSQIQAINYNDEYDIYQEVINRLFFVTDLDAQNNGVMIHDYIINDINVFFDNGFNQGYDSGYANGYDEGYDVGDTNGYNRGYNVGYDAGDYDGYRRGWDQGYARGKSDGENYNIHYFWLRNTLDAMNDFLSLQLFPGVNIGLMVGVPLVFGVLRLILFIWRSGD